ncbi:recombinase family protein [Lachnospiraceae bacterium NSJ-143]|nr:recombinase family protein [Lachnospiraceae bacterium NSJ-143]
MDTRAAAYIRVSTDEQAEFSPAAQKRAILIYAEKNNIKINENNIYADEGISGRKAEKRPAFMKMISDAKTKPQQFSIILVHKFDRFARNREDSVVYKSLLKKECGIRVVSVTEQLEDDKFSIILEAMLEAMAEYYSLNLSDEVKKGMFEKARRGEHIGRAPYGYNLKEKLLVPDSFELKTVEKIFKMYTADNLSALEIARYLNENGIFTKCGNKWRARSINYILTNNLYAGYTRYNYFPKLSKKPNPPDEWIIKKSRHIPAVDENMFQAASAKYLNTPEKYVVRTGKILFISQNMIYCLSCGKRLTLKRSGNGYYSYTCGLCKKSVSASKAEKFIISTVENSPFFSNIIVSDGLQQPNDINYIHSALESAEKKLKLVRKAYLSGADTLDEYIQSKKEIEENISEYNKKLHELAKKQHYTLAGAMTLKSALLSDNIPVKKKNLLARKFINKIYADLNTKSFSTEHE